MNTIILWNILSFIIFSSGGILLLRNRTHLQLTPGEFLPLSISIALYSFIALSNTLEHSGLTDFFDPYEDVSELTFLFMSLFFINNWRAQRDLEILRESEQQLASTLLTLSEKEHEYRVLVEKANDAIFVIQDEKIVFANEQTIDLMGYSPDEVASKVFFNFIHPDDQQLVFTNFSTLLNSEKDTLPSYKFRALNKDESELTIQLNTALITWNDQPAILCFASDITAVARLEEKLFHSQKMESIGTLAGGVAHDFNNILSAIIGYTELAKEKINDNSAISDLEKVLTAGDRAKQLVKQILNISRQSQGNLIPVDIHLVVLEALNLLRSSIPSTINIKHDIDKQSGFVLSDPTQIHQIIMNLCTNAYHAMRDDGGGTLSILLRKKHIGHDDSLVINTPLLPGEYLELAVSDTGVGIKKEIIPKIFDPYFTTKSKNEGTGLGLAVVHGIIKSYGGSVSVYSEYGKGSTFCIHLPRYIAEVSQQAQITYPDCPTGDEKGLVVDDEELISEMTTTILEGLGYQVTSTTDSVFALKLFNESPDQFDFVITDMTMPRLDGVKLITKIREINPDIPIVLCTGFSESIDSHKAASLNVKFLMKPVVKLDLANAVREALDR